MLFKLFKNFFGKSSKPVEPSAVPSDYDEEWYQERILALRIQLHQILANKYKCTNLSYEDMVYGDISQVIDDAKFKLFTSIDPTTREMVYEFKGKYFRLTKDKSDRKSLETEKSRIESIIEKLKYLRDALVKHGHQPNTSTIKFSGPLGITFSTSPIITVSPLTGGGSWPSVPVGIPTTGATTMGGTLPSFPATTGSVMGTSFPITPLAGDLFYRTDESKLYMFDGTLWQEV